jgi:hypothetical protein
VTLRVRITQTVIVNVAWTMVWIELRSGLVAGLIRPFMPWS